MRQVLLLIPLLLATLSAAESAGWDKGDPEADGVEGTRTEKAYAELKLLPPAQPVVVAVIDSGVDTAHPDLTDRLWINTREQAGKPGVDEDGNGFVDDVVGWNFLGSKDGKRQLDHASLEVTREYARMLAKRSTAALEPADSDYLEHVERMYFTKRTESLQQFLAAAAMSLQYDQAIGQLRRLGLRETTDEAIAVFAKEQPKAARAASLIQTMVTTGMSPAFLARTVRAMSSGVLHHFDLTADPSTVIGDDAGKLDEVGYGNGQVAVAEAYHGTHVAGIIGAKRGNGLGIDGQCEWARIMPLVAVPDGDERDKDVANAIRYAVDNGARIINCSFGKSLSPDQAAVEAALRHAEAKGVLIVHAAGNAALDLDSSANFPSPVARGGAAPHRYRNWIEVGASSRSAGPELVATFSNYGRDSLDLFAPGTGIRSTIPGNAYDEAEGTSMAAPQVAGVAALVWSQYPRLTAADLRAVLLVTARTHPDLAVRKPGEGELVKLTDLCLSGGIVDAFAALSYLAKHDGLLVPADRTRVQEWTARAEQPR